MNKKLLIAAALATTAVGGIAVTAGAVLAPRGPMAADTNKDGIVSRGEFFAAAQSRFADRDTNGDRKLIGSEIETGRDGAKLLRDDTNADGIISFAEASAVAAAQFKDQDANGDKRLTDDEVRPRPPHGPGGPGAGRGGGRMAEMMLERADTNNDGRITRNESRADSDRRFDRLDANRDGVIDRAELEARRGPGRGPDGGPRGPDGRRAIGGPGDDILPPAPPLPPPAG